MIKLTKIATKMITSSQNALFVKDKLKNGMVTITVVKTHGFWNPARFAFSPLGTFKHKCECSLDLIKSAQ